MTDLKCIFKNCYTFRSVNNLIIIAASNKYFIFDLFYGYFTHFYTFTHKLFLDICRLLYGLLADLIEQFGHELLLSYRMLFYPWQAIKRYQSFSTQCGVNSHIMNGKLYNNVLLNEASWRCSWDFGFVLLQYL